MTGPKFKRFGSRSALAAVLACGPLLAGCSQVEDMALADTYKPSYDERYAIKVEKAPSSVGVVAHQGQLTPEQINALSGFANEARTNAQSRVTIKYPSGANGGRQAASDVAEIMVSRGVVPGMIAIASYGGGSTSPIQVSFLRKVAVTKPCGNWGTDLGQEYGNDGYENFGCAIRNNMAAMVTNPEDFEGPRPMDPSIANNRTAAITIYMQNPNAGTVTTTQSKDSSSGSGSSGGGGGGSGGGGGGSGG